MGNMFAEAAKPNPPSAITHTVTTHPPFFQAAIEQDNLKRKARNMSRQEMFNNGFITVEDMDDEELRYGMCRDASGRIPRRSNKTELVPRDLYDEMVLEHERRTDEKLRQQLDSALETMVDCMVDKTAEWKDRTDAAKWLFERVKGKTPEKVQVTVQKAPWEEMLMGVANGTKRAQAGQQQDVVDAEVVEAPIYGWGPEAAKMTEADDVPDVPPGFASEASQSGMEMGGRSQATVQDNVERDQAQHVVGDPRIPPNECAPTHDRPAGSNHVVEQSVSEQLRVAQAEAAELAERRKAARDAIKKAKAQRIAKRALGLDAVDVDLSSVHAKFAAAMDEAPDDPVR